MEVLEEPESLGGEPVNKKAAPKYFLILLAQTHPRPEPWPASLISQTPVSASTEKPVGTDVDAERWSAATAEGIHAPRSGLHVTKLKSYCVTKLGEATHCEIRPI